MTGLMLAPRRLRSLGFDDTTMVTSTPWTPDWLTGRFIDDAPTSTKVNDPVAGPCARVNIGHNAPGLGILYNSFCAPATSVRIRVRMKIPPGESSGSVRIQLVDVAGAVVGSALTVTTQAGLTTHDLDVAGLTLDTMYGAQVAFNVGGAQTAAYVKSIEVIPLNSAHPIFGAPRFLRMHASHRASDTNGDPQRGYGFGGSYANCIALTSSNASFDVMTDGGAAAVEYGGTEISLDLNGQRDALVSDHDGALRIANWPTLPAGLNRVSARNGPEYDAFSGTWVKALYVLPGTRAWRPSRANRRAPRGLFYGNSIVTRYTDVAGRGMVDRLRKRGTVMGTLRSYAGRTFWADAHTPELRTAFFTTLLTVAFDFFWSEIGTNDVFGVVDWGSPEAFGAAYGAFMDEFHRLFPDKHFYAQSPFIRSDDNPTIQAYRNQIYLCTLTRPWSTYVDGTAIVDVSDLVDGVHPGPAGHVKWANYVENVLGVGPWVNPTTLASMSLARLYDPNDLTAGAVASWPGGVGLPPTLTGHNSPLAVANELAGNKVVRFDDALSQYLDAASGGASLDGASSFVLFAVFKHTTTDTLALFNLASDALRIGINPTGVLYLTINGTGGYVATPNYAAIINSWTRVIWTFIDGVVTCRVNGRDVPLTTTGTLPTTLSLDSDHTQIGRYGNAGPYYYKGDLGIVGAGPGVYRAGKVDDLDSLLVSRFALPV